jgi:hypothetical protein
MAILTLLDGKKGPGDILVLVRSYDEPLSIAEILYINNCILDSEAMYYPISKGYSGKAYFLNAINELACGVPFERVLEKYGLKRKKRLKIIDKRKQKQSGDLLADRGGRAKISPWSSLNSEKSH